MRGRGVRMSRRDLEKAIRLSREGNVGDALDSIKPPKKERVQHAGKSRASQLAHETGHAFQKAVRESLALEAAAGRCTVNEGNPEVGGIPGAMYPKAPATVDFQLLSAGIGIAFDCKTVHDTAEFSVTSYVGAEKAIEKLERQIDYLLAFRKQGGIAFLLLYEPKRGRAWLCFALQTLRDGGSVKIRTLEKEARGIPARIVDHLPALEPSPRLVGVKWAILDAALRHGLKTLPLESPFRKEA